MTGRDLVGHADTLQRLGLGFQRIGDSLGMEVHVDQGRSQEFHGGKALAVVAGLQQLVQQRLWHRFAGFVMAGKAGQDFRFFQPVLVQL